MLKFKRGRITQISVCLPNIRTSLKEVAQMIPLDESEAEKIIKTTGFTHIREVKNETALDLCLSASKKILGNISESEKNEIDAIIFVSQTRDYILPQSSNIIQHLLGLRKDIICMDLPLGCSGYLYGLIQSFTLINSNFRKILLLAGETNSKLVSNKDKTTKMVFGDGGTATLLENCGIEKDEIIFDYGTDGSGFKDIIVNSGGARNPVSSKSLSMINFGPGIDKCDVNISMNGLEVMNFAINRVPESIHKCLSTIDPSSIHKYYLHQANKFMLNYISKKAKIDKNKVPFNAGEIGNTGPASIPIAIAKDIQNNSLPNKSVLCGFGVGLSWATCIIDLKSICKTEIFNYED